MSAFNAAGATYENPQAHAFGEGDLRRHLLGLAEISFTGCFNVNSSASGVICMHEGSIWHAQRHDQIHILSWLRTIGAIRAEDEVEWEGSFSSATLREAASKDPNLDLSVIENRSFDYVAAEVAAILDAPSGTVALVPGDVTDNRFVAAWTVKHVLQTLAERCNLPRSDVFGPTDPAQRQVAQADLFDLGVIVEN